MTTWDQLKNFAPHEFVAPDKMDLDFMAVLDSICAEAKIIMPGLVMAINSSYRPPLDNKAAGGVDDSAHVQIPCRGVDVRCHSSVGRWAIVTAAINHGIRRIGIGKRFVHLDDDPTKPAQVIWTYYD